MGSEDSGWSRSAAVGWWRLLGLQTVQGRIVTRRISVDFLFIVDLCEQTNIDPLIQT